LVWWWKGEESFIEILRVLQINVQNLEENWVLLSERISYGSLWSLNIWVINVLVVSSDKGNGIKLPILVNLSSTTIIQVNPLEKDRSVIELMESEAKGQCKLLLWNRLQLQLH